MSSPPLDPESAAEVLRRLRSERDEHRSIAISEHRRAEAVNGLIRMFLKTYPELEDEPDELTPQERPKGSQACRIILEEDPSVAWDVGAMVSELRSRGWLPESDNPANAVRVALERLVTKVEERFGKTRDLDGDGLIQYFSRKGSWKTMPSMREYGLEFPVNPC